MSTIDNIDKIKVWTTDKNKEPDDSNLALSRKVSAAELNSQIEVDIWADFIADGVPKKKVGSVTFSYKDQPTGEIVPSIVYSPPKVDVDTIVLVDGSGTKASSPTAIINSWSWKVTNEGGMTYPVDNSDKIQASFKCPDLNWLYVTLTVGDTNNKTASKKIRIDIGEPQPPTENHPPIAVAGGDKVVKEKTIVTLDGSQSHDTDTGDSIVKYEWTQTYGEPQVQIINKYQSIANFVAPEIVVEPPPPPPPPPDTGEYNEHGTKMLYKTTGKKVTMNVGSDHRNGQRYNTNHKFQNYMQIGYFKIATNQKQIEQKTDGPNHGSCTKLPQCMWYEPDLYVDGTVRLGMEYPHPDNHAVDNSLLEVDAPLKVGDLKGKWIGYSVIAYWKGDPKNGNRVIEQWVDPTPFDANGKPQNKWQLTLKAVENGQLFPKQYFPRTLPVDYDEGLESEIRMHCGEKSVGADMKWSYVYEIVPPLVAAATTSTDNDDDDDDDDDDEGTTSFLERSETKLEDTKSLAFRLTVTDTKGATNSDDVIVTVTKDVIEPPVECPPGQHYDPVQQKCIPDEPPTVEEVIISHVGDTHGEKEPLDEIVTKVKPNFLIHSGDITDTESDDDNYIQYTKDLGLVYGQTFANSEGNHESPEESGEGAQKDMEEAFPILKQTKWMQTYQVKNVFIIIGNTQISGYSQPDSEHMQFIKDSLAKAKQLRDSGQIDWIFYCQHKPYYTMKARHDSEYNFRYNVHPLFDEYGVDISVHGHNHDMQRTKPITYGGPNNTPPVINNKMIGDAHDMSNNYKHGIIVAINGSSTKNTSFSGSQDAWTVYANANFNAHSVYKIKGKQLIGQYIEIGTGKVLHEFRAAKQ